MSDTAIREAMDYEKQFTTNNELKSAYWEHGRTMRDIASALYSRKKIGQERGKKIGDKAGRQALSALLQKLLQEGRTEDINRVLQDNEYQENARRTGCNVEQGSGLIIGLWIEVRPLPPLTRSPFHLSGTASNVANRLR